MIAVNACWDSCRRQLAGHELQQGHLCRGILHGHPVRLELEVGSATDIFAIVRICEERLLDILEMGVQDLLGQRESSIYA